MRWLSIFAFAVLALFRANGQINESGSLAEVEFSQLSQRDPSPLGEKALAIHPEQWKHAETDHFIYHFVHGYVATPVSVEAEFHYRAVAKELERDQPTTDIKSHIYIFERPEDWQEFQTYGNLEKWSGGIHSEGYRVRAGICRSFHLDAETCLADRQHLIRSIAAPLRG